MKLLQLKNLTFLKKDLINKFYLNNTNNNNYVY